MTVKLEIARGLFLIAALSTSVMALTAWAEPTPQVLSGLSPQSDCRVPANARRNMLVQPDQDLLLVIFSLSQALKS
jgi:Mg2+/citrate symporter